MEQFNFELSKIKETSLEMFFQHILEGFSMVMEDDSFIKEYEEREEGTMERETIISELKGIAEVSDYSIDDVEKCIKDTIEPSSLYTYKCYMMQNLINQLIDKLKGGE